MWMFDVVEFIYAFLNLTSGHFYLLNISILRQDLQLLARKIFLNS